MLIILASNIILLFVIEVILEVIAIYHKEKVSDNIQKDIKENEAKEAKQVKQIFAVLKKIKEKNEE